MGVLRIFMLRRRCLMDNTEKDAIKELIRQIITDMANDASMTNEDGGAMPANVTPNIGRYDAKLSYKVNKRKLKDYDLLDDEDED